MKSTAVPGFSVTKVCKGGAKRLPVVATRAKSGRNDVLINRHRNMASTSDAAIFRRRQGVTDSASPSHMARARSDDLEVAPLTGDASPSSSYNMPAVLACVAVASLGAFAFGYHLGVVNGPLSAIAADLGFAGNTQLEGLVVSAVLAGAAAGSLGGSGVADALGRRTAFLITAVPMALGAVLCATASDLAMMVIGRLLAGVGIGLSSALVPLYISEVSPTKIRGALGSLNQLVICIGILGALLVNVALPSTAWRSMMWFAAAPAALLFLGMAVSPESPRWLLDQGRAEEARSAAQRLWNGSAMAELGEASAGAKAEGGASWGDIFGSRYGRLVLIGATIFLLQQFSGINAVVYFSSAVFRQAGVANEALASAAVGAINVVGTIIAASLMDRAGRKQLLTFSFSMMGLSMCVLAAGLALPALKAASGTIALVGTLAYVLSFALGAGPVPALLLPEIFPAKIRGRGVAMALGTHWVCNFGIGQLFLPAVSRFGVSGAYLFFAAVCFIAVVWAQSTLIETKGKSLEEIEQQLLGS